MDAFDAQDALVARLKAMPGLPQIAYPNGPLTEGLPRVVVQVPSAPMRNVTIGGCAEGEAQIVARIEVEQGKLDTDGKAIGKAIIAHFAPVQRFDGVTVIDAPTEQARYEVGGVYHIPVLIRAKFYT